MQNKKIDWFFVIWITAMLVIVDYLLFDDILMAIVLGLAIGAVNAWLFSKKSDKDIANKSAKNN
ncbi:hypothetical protein [Psychrobacter sp. I-STPA10]|uniref:hypothetical protein n=1 Tax=Psychrobacter sp. I-STPA10 TaxID=2585769 RepID=UPI001E3AA536|nr:hypothetical protein [Psychrobacter sp. I-STPA10]